MAEDEELWTGHRHIYSIAQVSGKASVRTLSSHAAPAKGGVWLKPWPDFPLLFSIQI